MTRIAPVTLCGLMLAIATPALAGGPLDFADMASVGPFAGTVTQSETDIHRWTSPYCSVFPSVLVVAMTYAPPSDRLTLSVDGRSVTGNAGRALIKDAGGVCTDHAVSVTGTMVAATAAYQVDVVWYHTLEWYCLHGPPCPPPT